MLRPLCEMYLPETRPAREGWIDRDQLYDFSGRSRKPQMALARQFGFEDYAQPAGGCCFLTDKQYSAKLADLWQSRGERRYELDDIMLLKVGRHVRPRPNFKLIIGRDEGENNFLEGYRKQFTHLRSTSHKGPLVLLDGDIGEEDLDLAARLLGRFSQGRDASEVEVEITRGDETRARRVKPLPPDEIRQDWYL